MGKSWRFTASLMTLLALGACADAADTFPMNAEARKIGRLQLDFVRQGIDRGPVSITMPDQERLTGYYRVNRSGFVGMAFAGGQSASAIGFGDGAVQFVAHGPRTEMLCRGTTSAFGHGNGECQTVEGAVWAISW
jgi:hypothetical protein